MVVFHPGIVVAAATGAALVGIAAYALRRYRRRNEIFVSYPTMFGTVHIYTVRRDADQDVLDQFGAPLARADAPASPQDDARADATESAPSPDEITWVRVMELDGALQSATFLDDDRCYDLVFDYYKLYNHLFEAPITVGSMLVLGGGGYAYPKFVVSRFPTISVDVVEIDPAITSLAERYFFLDRLIEEYETETTGRLNLICDDGRAYLERCEKTYDVVVNDTFAGKQPALQLATIEAIRLVKQHLTPGGIYLTNVVASLTGPQSKLMRLACNTLQRVFRNVLIVSAKQHLPHEAENYILIATDGDYEFSGIVQRPDYPKSDEVLRDVAE